MTMPSIANSISTIRAFAATAVVCATLIQGCASTQRVPTRASQATEAEELYNGGIQAFSRGDDVRAEHYLALAMRKGYPERPALLLLLRLCLAGSRLRAALNYAEPYLHNHPTDSDLRYLVATLYHGLNQAPLALRELEQVLASNPDHAEAHFLFALLLHDDHVADAEAMFDRQNNSRRESFRWNKKLL